jgi:hypothetical protein
MTRIKQHQRNLRFGSTFQSTVATALFAPGTGYLAPTEPKNFAHVVSRLTDFDAIGSISGKLGKTLAQHRGTLARRVLRTPSHAR